MDPTEVKLRCDDMLCCIDGDSARPLLVPLYCAWLGSVPLMEGASRVYARLWLEAAAKAPSVEAALKAPKFMDDDAGIRAALFIKAWARPATRYGV